MRKNKLAWREAYLMYRTKNVVWLEILYIIVAGGIAAINHAQSTQKMGTLVLDWLDQIEVFLPFISAAIAINSSGIDYLWGTRCFRMLRERNIDINRTRFFLRSVVTCLVPTLVYLILAIEQEKQAWLFLPAFVVLISFVTSIDLFLSSVVLITSNIVIPTCLLVVVFLYENVINGAKTFRTYYMQLLFELQQGNCGADIIVAVSVMILTYTSYIYVSYLIDKKRRV